jgi:predicted phosphodiesterase
MQIAILSDIHGNLPALEAVVARLKSVDKVICLGDVVNYGPWNDECLEMIQALPKIVFLEGNHEALFLGKEPLEHEIPLVQQFYHASFASFTRHDLISNLPVAIDYEGYLWTHTLDGRKIYKDTKFLPPRDCVIGHTHHAFQVAIHGKTVINPGSVGQNRKSLDIACYGLFDSETRQFLLENATYPVELLLSEMKSRRYPQECLEYYQSKL